jgi:hypothetical protein
MLAFLTWFGSFLSGPIISALAKGWAAHEAAVNTGVQIEATKEVQLAEVTAQIDAASKQLLIAEQGHWWTSAVRPLIAAPFAIFIVKVVVWDTVFKMGHTDSLTPEMYGVMSVVVASYFGTVSIERVARIVSRKK